MDFLSLHSRVISISESHTKHSKTFRKFIVYFVERMLPNVIGLRDNLCTTLSVKCIFRDRQTNLRKLIMNRRLINQLNFDCFHCQYTTCFSPRKTFMIQAMIYGAFFKMGIYSNLKRKRNKIKRRMKI